MAVIALDPIEDRASWLEFRRTRISATDVAKAVTGHYGGAWAAVDEKLADPDPDDTRSDAMQRGIDAETPMADAVAALTGLTVGAAQPVVTHPDHDEFMATLDAELLDPTTATLVALLEEKTVGPGRPAPWDYYRTQVAWQLFVRQHPTAVLAVGRYREMDDGTEALTSLSLEPVHRDPDIEQHLVEVADRLLGHLRARTRPPSDGSRFVSQRIRARFATADPAAAPVDLTEFEELLYQRDDLKAQAAELERAATAIDDQIIERLGAATHGVSPSWEFTYKPVMSPDRDRLWVDHPDVMLRHTVVSAATDMAAVARDLGRKQFTPYKTIPGTRRVHVKET